MVDAGHARSVWLVGSILIVLGKCFVSISGSRNAFHSDKASLVYWQTWLNQGFCQGLGSCSKNEALFQKIHQEILLPFLLFTDQLESLCRHGQSIYKKSSNEECADLLERHVGYMPPWLSESDEAQDRVEGRVTHVNNSLNRFVSYCRRYKSQTSVKSKR